MTEIKNDIPRPPSRESAVKCLSQGHNRMGRVGFEPRPFDHNYCVLTTRLR